MANVNRTCILSVFILFAAANLFCTGNAEVGEAEHNVDYLGIAALLVRDGHFDRARTALEKVDHTAEGLDKARYYTLHGLLAFQEADFGNTVKNLETALRYGQENRVIYVYLSQAYYKTGEYEKAIKTLQGIENLGRFPELLGIQSQSHWMLKETVEAFLIIDRAIEQYPGKLQFLQQRIFYLLELELYQEAFEQSREYLKRAGNDPSAYLLVGEALRRGGEFEQAIRIYETALLLYPDNGSIREALAYAYVSNGQPSVAARIIAQAAEKNSEYFYKTAELFRRSGEYNRALYMNLLVDDQSIRARQRFHFLVELERYEEALAMKERLEQLGAFKDDGIKYAFAYLYFNIGQFEEAEHFLKQIHNPSFRSTVIQLQRAIHEARKLRNIK